MILAHLPRLVDPSLYAETREEVMRKYKNLPGVAAILEFGTMPYPGISDMDFFIVVEPHAEVILPHFSEYTEEQRFAMMHRHLILSKRLFQFINEFDPWFVAVQALYDPLKQYSFQKDHFDAPGYEALSLNFLYQKLVYGCLPMLAEILRSETIPCREFFEEIKLFRYFLREFKKLSIEYGEEDPALDSYRALAEQWFTVTGEEKQKRMEEAVESYKHSILWTARALLKALSAVPAKTLARPLPPRTRLQKELLTRFPESFILDRGAQVFVYQKNATELSIEIEKLRTIFRLPLSFACFSTTHLELQGCLSEFYQAHACTDLSAIPLWQHQRLTSFFTHANENVWETRNVKNGKYYEITYGYRPPPGSIVRRIRLFLPSIPSRLARHLLYRREKPKVLFASSLTSK